MPPTPGPPSHPDAGVAPGRPCAGSRRAGARPLPRRPGLLRPGGGFRAPEAQPPRRIPRARRPCGRRYRHRPHRRCDGKWTPLQLNQPLTTGDQVFTDVGGQGGAAGRLVDGAAWARIRPHFTRLDDEQIRLRFDHGSMALRVRSAERDRRGRRRDGRGRFPAAACRPLPLRSRTGPALRAMAWSATCCSRPPTVRCRSRPPSAPKSGRRATRNHALPDAVAIPVDDFSEWAQAEIRRGPHARRHRRGRGGAVRDDGRGGAEPVRQLGDPDRLRIVWYPSHVYAGWAPYTYGYWNWVGPWAGRGSTTRPGASRLPLRPLGLDRRPLGLVPGALGRRPVYAPGLVGLGGRRRVHRRAPADGRLGAARAQRAVLPGYPVSGTTGTSSTAIRRTCTCPAYHRADRGWFAPGQSVAYANRGVQGAVSFAPAQSLSSRQPVSSHRPPAQHETARGRPGRQGADAGAPRTRRPDDRSRRAPWPRRRPSVPSRRRVQRAPRAGRRPARCSRAQRPGGPGGRRRARRPGGTCQGRPGRAGAHRTRARRDARRDACRGGHRAADGRSSPAPVRRAARRVQRAGPPCRSRCRWSNPNAPVPLVNPNAPVPLVNKNAPVPLVQSQRARAARDSTQQTRPGTPILVRVAVARSAARRPMRAGTTPRPRQRQAGCAGTRDHRAARRAPASWARAGRRRNRRRDGKRDRRRSAGRRR
jgi:hypothetical protein